MLSQCLTLSKVCVGVCGDLSSVLGFQGGGGGFLCSLSILTLSFSVLHFWTQRLFFLFAIVSVDECLAIFSSGGFETGRTNDLGSFVPGLKGRGNGAYCKEEQLSGECSLFIYMSYFRFSFSRSFFYLKLSWQSLVKPIESEVKNSLKELWKTSLFNVWGNFPFLLLILKIRNWHIIAVLMVEEVPIKTICNLC